MLRRSVFALSSVLSFTTVLAHAKGGFQTHGHATAKLFPNDTMMAGFPSPGCNCSISNSVAISFEAVMNGEAKCPDLVTVGIKHHGREAPGFVCGVALNLTGDNLYVAKELFDELVGNATTDTNYEEELHVWWRRDT